MAPFFGICEKSFLYKQILQNILRTLLCLFGLREAIAKGNFKNHVQLLSKMPAEIAKAIYGVQLSTKMVWDKIAHANVQMHIINMIGRCDSQAKYCTLIKKIFPKLLFIKPPARSPGMEKQQIIVDYM
ncbi:hypothetical protein T4C_10347 [Trichinella pseudospiralis]|uniref:Uncharacterized protein n=1 Tax=Trichinella pseudospiralis TaxID=6337 RepID=A0A0V1HMI4_TRIPS|nr:hypothetical protein T4C_10347 [Trichinella pseudospiralis]